MKVNVDVGHQVPLPTVNKMKQINKVCKEWFSSKGKICLLTHWHYLTSPFTYVPQLTGA